jgi:hypothetical protein
MSQGIFEQKETEHYMEKGKILNNKNATNTEIARYFKTEMPPTQR